MGSPWQEAKRLVAGDWWGPEAKPGWLNPRLVLVVMGLLVVAFGVGDYITGPVRSLTVFYLIPTSIGTIVAGRRAGMALAAESALASTAADFAGVSNDRIVFVLNGLLLFLILLLIVVLIA